MPPHESQTSCGTVVLVGRPNTGKSSLLNALVGAKLAITSRRPQSTREPVVGINTDGATQLLVVDQPGLLDPTYLLQQAMLEAALRWVRRADSILYLHPAPQGEPPSLAALVPALGRRPPPLATVLTMADRLQGDPPPPAPAPTFLVSAVTGEGISSLLEWCRAQAPPGPFREATDSISTQPVRFFAAEFVRESAFELLEQELPYALATEVDEFRDGAEPVYIRVTVYVERESQKAIVLGKRGRTVKALGAAARRKIETLLGQPVYLDLWVKILPKWRKDANALARFGLPVSSQEAP